MRLSSANAPFPVVVPMELCTVIGGQLYKKKLPSHLVSEAVRFSTVRPDRKMGTILNNSESPVRVSIRITPHLFELLKQVQGYARSAFIHESGMVVSPQAVTVNGKLLVTPPLEFGNGAKVVRAFSWHFFALLTVNVYLDCSQRIVECPWTKAIQTSFS